MSLHFTHSHDSPTSSAAALSTGRLRTTAWEQKLRKASNCALSPFSRLRSNTRYPWYGDSRTYLTSSWRLHREVVEEETVEASVVGEVEAIVEEEEVEGVVAGVSLQKFDSGLAFICLEYGETALKDSTAPLGKARGFGDRGGRGGARGGRGAPRGGGRGGARGGRGGAKGGAKVIIEPHRHPGVFVARGKEDMLVTKNLTPGESVYGEKRISVESSSAALPNGTPTNPAATGANAPPTTKTEYRVWNPFRSKLAAGILGGLEDIFIRPGTKVLYLGAASGTSVSHVADIVGPNGTVYAVEFSHRSGRDLINMATHRTNVIPIIEDARHPLRYRMLVGMVDTVFADVAQPDQARIVGLNCHLYLKVGGGVVVSVKANCIDSTAAPEAVFAREVGKMREERIKPIEQLTLEPFERDHCIVVGRYTRSST
ncbi:MAG: hypothetical protein L6R40_007709 [Gallowayella cf. fulva]|nr:MAG: hypothetical protein L6R40_007709 [Xanthomendoza cf. fulva]